MGGRSLAWDERRAHTSVCSSRWTWPRWRCKSKCSAAPLVCVIFTTVCRAKCVVTAKKENTTTPVGGHVPLQLKMLRSLGSWDILWNIKMTWECIRQHTPKGALSLHIEWCLFVRPYNLANGCVLIYGWQLFFSFSGDYFRYNCTELANRFSFNRYGGVFKFGKC